MALDKGRQGKTMTKSGYNVVGNGHTEVKDDESEIKCRPGTPTG